MSSFEVSPVPADFVDPNNKFLKMSQVEKDALAALRTLVIQMMESEIKPKVNEEVFQHYNNVLNDVYLFKVCKIFGFQNLNNCLECLAFKTFFYSFC